MEFGGKRVGLQIFTMIEFWEGEGVFHEWRSESSKRSEFVTKLDQCAVQDNIDLVYVIFDEDVWSYGPMAELAKLMDDFNADSKTTKIFPLNGMSHDIAMEITSRSGHILPT